MIPLSAIKSVSGLVAQFRLLDLERAKISPDSLLLLLKKADFFF